MASITLQNITLAFGARTLFENANVSFNPGRYAITGPNGAGKSSLVKIISGKMTPTMGQVSRPKKMGVLRQDIEHYHERIVTEVVYEGNLRLWNALQERDKLYDVEMTDEVGLHLGELEGIIAEEDGYSAESDAHILLSGMGIHEEFFEKRMKEIPTDLQFRVLLCQALFGDPEALLLDEPTNHLDLVAIGWLETFLHNYSGILILISHDRHFLNSVVDYCADIDYETVILYPGNYDDMVMSKTSFRNQAEKEAKSKEKKIVQLQQFVDRFRAGTRSSQVQSRMREIDRLEPQKLKESNIQRPYIRLVASETKPGKLIFKLDHVKKGYDEKAVIKDFSLEIERDDKIAVIGPNGAGKTTLLKLLASVHQADAGSLEIGHNVQVCYFPQNHHEILNKACGLNALQWLQKQKPGAYEQDIRGVMGKMLFGGDDAFKNIETLSGGETARVILAQMMLLDHNVLILDEPNNHLDLESVIAIGEGLEKYRGTVVFATHDRDLIEHVATRIISLAEDGSITVYNGPYSEFLASKTTK